MLDGNYGFSGEVPDRVSIEENVQRALDYKNSHSDIETAIWFYKTVSNNKQLEDGTRRLPLDASMNYKQLDDPPPGVKNKYEDFGNYNYGVVGKAIGFTDYALEFMAGWAQGVSNEKLSTIGAAVEAITDPVNHNDDPNDQTQIRAGIQAAKDGGVEASTSLGALNVDTPMGLFGIFIGLEMMANLDGLADGATGVWDGLTGLMGDLADGAADLLGGLADGAAGLLGWLFPDGDGNGLPPGTAPMGLTDPIPTSPLVLDLDGDGIETVGMASGIQFDLNNNGFCETVGWVGADDGLLALDRDGDGAITGGFELFGNNTLLESGSRAANGFLALAELDGNKDGVIDAGDEVFSQLRVWRDTNQNGESDAGELLSLEEAGVSRLNLGYATGTAKDAYANEFRQLGIYVDTDGNSKALIDVWFKTNPTISRPINEVPVSEDLQPLPDAAGFGNVRTLHEGRGIRSSFATMQNLTVRPVVNHFR